MVLVFFTTILTSATFPRMSRWSPSRAASNWSVGTRRGRRWTWTGRASSLRRTLAAWTSRAAWTGSGLRTAGGFPEPGWSLRHKIPRPHHTGNCRCGLCCDQVSSFTDHGNSNHHHHTACICMSIVQSPIPLFESLLVTTLCLLTVLWPVKTQPLSVSLSAPGAGVWSILQVSSVCLNNINWAEEANHQCNKYSLAFYSIS